MFEDFKNKLELSGEEDKKRLQIMEDRRSKYGNPETHFIGVGKQWGAILANHFNNPVIDIPPHIVALMLASLKINRAACKVPNEEVKDIDDYLDLKNYADISRILNPAVPFSTQEEILNSMREVYNDSASPEVKNIEEAEVEKIARERKTELLIDKNNFSPFEVDTIWLAKDKEERKKVRLEIEVDGEIEEPEAESLEGPYYDDDNYEYKPDLSRGWYEDLKKFGPAKAIVINKLGRGKNRSIMRKKLEEYS